MVSAETKHVASKIVESIGRDALKHKVFGRSKITVILDEDIAKAFLVEHVGSEFWQPSTESDDGRSNQQP